jgi:rfaE bifunctional protein kinase chain/domain
VEVFNNVSQVRLCEIIEKIKGVRVGVFGDLCLDVYWHADMRMSELSRETPHFAMPIVKERISLGGGGNVAANLAALKPKAVKAAGTMGRDWRGTELVRLMNEIGVETEHIVCEAGLVTNAFCKPLRMGISETVYEDPRLDFANVSPFDLSVEESLIDSINKLSEEVDILCVCNQLPTNVYGAVTVKVREHLNKLAKNGLAIIVDSRDNIGLYTGMILKPNEIECARAVGHTSANDLHAYAKSALALADMQNSEVIMTIGARGSLYAANGKLTHIPARAVSGQIDIVGAGDTFISGFALATAAGASRTEAAFFAGLCSEVTIRKIGTTGTASADEILAWYGNIRDGKAYENY